MQQLDYPPTVASFVRHQAEARGDSPLIVLGERRLGYADAERRSAVLARGLLADGAGKGTRIGLLMPNGPEWVLAWLAAARIGALVVPLNTFYKTRELGWALHHADIDTLLTVDGFLGNDYLSRLEEYAPELGDRASGSIRTAALPYLRRVHVWGSEQRSWTCSAPGSLDQLAGEGDVDDELLAAVERSVSPADELILIYSSGSTADPKGAIHTHGAVLRHSLTLNGFRGITAEDRVYSPMPFFWVGGFVFVLLSAMHAGGCVLSEERFEAGATLEYLERERATIVAGWPHYGKAMSEHPDFASRDLSSIRSGNIYAIIPDSARPADPELRPNSLGMTETCGPHTIDDMERDLPERLRGSFGQSVPGLEHKVVDPGGGAPLAAGEPGEICVRGYSVMRGLYKVEREQTFDADGFYHTGDGGLFDADGYLFFEGRLGDVIKTAGANVSPREVEVVLEALPEVKAAYVVGVPDPARGQNVAAAVVLEPGATIGADDVRGRLRDVLSAYKIPRHVYFHTAAELPFTDTGKIDKRSLGDMLTRRVAHETG